MRAAPQRSRRAEEGATLLEFAIVAPVLLLLMFTMIDLSLIIIGNTVGGNAAREGARVGIIDYESADEPRSTNYDKIQAAVDRLLAGLVRERQLEVHCLASPDLTRKPCQRGVVRLDRDLIEVTVTWRHIGASPFVANSWHTQVARMVIVGKPDLSPPPPPPTTTTTTSTTPSTTTTLPPPPRRQSLDMYDRNNNGRVDEVVATFDNNIPDACGTTSMWALSNTPSSGTLADVRVSGRQATLVIAEGPEPPDTAVGSFTVTFNPTGSCTAEGFTNEPPTDRAGPVPVGIVTTTAGTTPGKMEPGDQLTITFSEPVVGIPATATVTEADRAGQGNDTISITGVAAGANDTGGNDYITKNNKRASFSANVAVVGNQVTVTLTGACTEDCTDLAAGAGAFSYLPATTVLDSANNQAAGTFVTSSTFRLF